MIRTLISLPRDIKVWLDDYSKKKNKPTAETIREALKQYKEKVESEKVDSLEATAGIWKEKKIGANEYVDKLRSEW
jgi:predicted DNA-binding protein